ncbi:MAG: hypothetical protein QM676_13660 [Novosphingobium sp.]
MIATLIATLFAGAALLALGAMVLSWHSFGFRFKELRAELAAAGEPVSVRYSRRDAADRPSALIYSLDFKDKADALPFHPELRPELQPELRPKLPTEPNRELLAA